MKKYFELFRVKHYTKNFLVFLPLIFGKKLLTDSAYASILGFVSFSLCSSAVYIMNDLFDIEKDRQHKTKSKRPIASGTIKPNEAVLILIALIIISFSIQLFILRNAFSVVYISAYFILNLAYSIRLKNIPILDVTILMSGYVIRILFGGQIIGVEISQWLFLTVMSAAFFAGLGKRRNEIIIQDNGSETRTVLKYYRKEFLNKFMYICLAISICFYSLWSINFDKKQMVWTVPLIIVLAMKYSLDIEALDDDDPVEIILKDKVFMLLATVYALLVTGIVYY